MRTRLVLFIIISASISAQAEGWLSYSEDKARSEVNECYKDKSPGEIMKFYDEMTIPYKKSEEKRDKENALISITITKNPGQTEEAKHFFKDPKACETEYKKVKAEFDKKNTEATKQENKKYEDYK